MYEGEIDLKVEDLYFNNNNITTLKLSYLIMSMITLNINSNNIFQIDTNAFLNCKQLVNLSISDNKLSQINKNNFYNQFKLKYLNLSHNRLYLIEADSFQNLLNLLSLDLSFNRLTTIENNVFKGLFNLNDLYLNNVEMFELKNDSFNYLNKLTTIYLNESAIIEYKCMFMHSIRRYIQRNVSNGKLVFYKSFNLISAVSNHSDINLDIFYCELTFQFLQFKVYFNLKTENENELFYLKCSDMMSKKKNNYNHSFQKCFANFRFKDDASLNNDFSDTQIIAYKVFSDVMFIWAWIFLFILTASAFVFNSVKNN